MALVTFQNLPNTSTPLNAENLNANFSLLSNQITARGSNMSFTTTEASVWTKLNLNSTLASVGNKLTLDATNNEIVIESGVSYISVSCGCVIIQQSAGMTYQSLSITKNGSNYGPYAQSRSNYTNPSIQTYNTLADILIPVNSGDRISMRVFNRLAGDLQVEQIYISVKVIG